MFGDLRQADNPRLMVWNDQRWVVLYTVKLDHQRQLATCLVIPADAPADAAIPVSCLIVSLDTYHAPIVHPMENTL